MLLQACWSATPLGGLDLDSEPLAMTPHQRKRILQLLIPLLVLLAAEKLHKGLGRALLSIGTVGLVLYCFINDDKSWARRILNKPKSWWMD